MNKSIEFTQSQIEAYENGATMFMFPCVNSKFEMIAMNDNFYVENYSPLQIGDKDVFIKEKQIHFFDDDEIASMGCAYSGEESETELVTIGKIKEVIDFRTVRVQDLKLFELLEITRKPIVLAKSIGFCDKQHIKFKEKYFIDFYNQQLKEQNIRRTYNDNDYLFLVEIKR